jgi:anti-sigma regulatory factor (Ser/Thr protein kinase)
MKGSALKPLSQSLLKLNLQTSLSFLSVVTTFIEKSAAILGLEEKEALLLTMAGEEIFSHLCQKAPDKEVEIQCSGAGYYVQIEFLIDVYNLDLKAFNLTTPIRPEEDAFQEDLGLILASRSVDRFQIWEEKGRGLHLCLIKEKVYPQGTDEVPLAARPLAEFFLKTPDREEIKLMARLALSQYPSQVLPVFFPFPGKVADMAAEKAFKAVVAVDPQGHMGGGILWYWRGAKIVACSGPYLFNQLQGSAIAEALVEAVLADIARTKAVGLLCRYPTADLPAKYFEPLGSFSFFPSEGSPLSITAYFRQLQEDPGAMVWSHPEMEPFLRQEFKRRTLPREIRTVTDFGEAKNPFSVLSPTFDRGRSLVTLQPVRPGRDGENNLRDHLEILRKEQWRNIYFEMDLSKSWQVEFVPALYNNHFRPCLVLPYAGDGDLVLFQAEAPASQSAGNHL